MTSYDQTKMTVLWSFFDQFEVVDGNVFKMTEKN